VHDLVSFIFPTTHKAKATLIERLTLKKALKKTSKVFVVSENTRKDLIKMFDYPKTNIALVPCSASDFYKVEINPKEAEATQKKYQLPARFILAVGTLEPRKNFTNVIKSFVILKRKYSDLKLVIVGKPGWKYHEIERAVKSYQLENEVVFLGYVQSHELNQIYHLATVFVFPSLYEGFGIPPLEAMSSGCPVVSSNLASMPEVIGDAGLLIDPKSAVKIADAISSLLENPQLRTMLIERGYRRSQKFSWENSAKAALEVFNEYS